MLSFARLLTRLLIPIVLAPLTGCGDGAPTSVSYTAATTPTHDCAKGPNVKIDTSDGTFKFTNTCERILINGGNNKVAIEAAKRIDLDGGKNVIEVGAADMIRIKGVGNTTKFKNKGVTRKTPDVVASGDNNSLIQSD